MVEPTQSHLPESQAVGTTPPQQQEPGEVTPAPAAAGRIGRYQVLGEVARGGMGAVLKVHDPSLGRTLALKVLLEGGHDQAQMARRFLEEAQIGGQLQHPGVVPVHELGWLDDGRPFFTMKLVKGRTLGELLRERNDPAADLPRLLQIFEQICQTVAYAHSRGIIHRDLKPSNVMVGSFGEVQVMDWGLAKVLGQGPAELPPAADARASTVFTSRAGDESATRAGTVLGTPAYMPPEQARGEVGHLDERCDVFGLGAVLCEILTGHPPYHGTREQVVALATEGNLADARARLENCEADAELVRLARSCLTYAPSERPANAAAVAQAVTAYREGVAQRLHQAEVDRAAVAARTAEERKRRRLRRVLVTLVLVVAIGAGAAWGWLERKRAAAEREVEIALETAAQLQAEEKWTEALTTARQAEGLLEGSDGSAALKERVAQRIAEITLVQRLDEIQLELADTTGNYLLVFDTTASQVGGRLLDVEYSKALKQFGVNVDELTESQAAERLKNSRVRAPVLNVLDNWAIARRRSRPGDMAAWQRLFALARKLDEDPWRNRLRDALALNDLAALRTLADRVDEAGQRPAALRTLGEELARLGDYPTGIALLRRAQQQYPDNVLLNARLARLLHSQRPPQWEEALRFATAAIALRPRSPGLLVEYAYLLMRRERMDECIAILEKAVAVKPDHPVALAELGNRLREKGEKERSRVLTQKALELFRQAIATDPDNDLHYYDEGLSLLNLGDPDRATQALRKAADLNPNFGECRLVMAEALVQLGLLDEALRAIREAVRLDPGNADYQNVLAVMLVEHGGPLKDARAAIDTSLLLYPSNAAFRLTLAEVLRAQGQIRESLEAYKYGQRLHETNARRWDWSPQVGQWVKQAERLEELDRLLPAIRKGERKLTSAAEYAECGQLCVYKCLYAASAEFYQQAFTLDVTLADDLGAGLRYQATRAAAMAGCGHDTENDNLDDAARARWRKQARDWLSADLTLRRKQLERGKPEDRKAVQYTLNHMRTHDHLAGIRDAAALTNLQKVEQAECQRLWSQVELLLKQAQQPQQ